MLIINHLTMKNNEYVPRCHYIWLKEVGSLVFEKWQMKISDQPLKYCLRADIPSSESLSSALKKPSM